jgi:type 1 fimbriae regulatory protein FimB/type 1 fimbriae regulatory protein FimE
MLERPWLPTTYAEVPVESAFPAYLGRRFPLNGGAGRRTITVPEICIPGTLQNRGGAEIMTNATLRLVTPAAEIGTVQPPRQVKDTRTRSHLTASEVDALIKVVRGNRYGTRDALMILMAYRHGLRAKEVVELRWDAVDFKAHHLHVRRAKNGTPSTHPLKGDELRALRQLKREHPQSAYVFISERDVPFSTAGFAKMVRRAGEAAELSIRPHAHMLRHGTGFALANAGRDTRSIQAYLGHASITNTTRYTALAPGRFKDFFPD